MLVQMTEKIAIVHLEAYSKESQSSLMIQLNTYVKKNGIGSLTEA